MSTDPEYDRVATLDHPNGQEVLLPATPVVVGLPVQTEPGPAPAMEAIPAAPPIPAKPSRPRPRWLITTAIAVVGLIASRTLGYLFYSTNAKLDATRQHLAATQTTLDSTKLQLSN